MILTVADNIGGEGEGEYWGGGRIRLPLYDHLLLAGNLSWKYFSLWNLRFRYR
jgi:hypothetical protein